MFLIVRIMKKIYCSIYRHLSVSVFSHISFIFSWSIVFTSPKSDDINQPLEEVDWAYKDYPCNWEGIPDKHIKDTYPWVDEGLEVVHIYNWEISQVRFTHSKDLCQEEKVGLTHLCWVCVILVEFGWNYDG